ncbi:MAG TPA: TrkH family potassium uptake protein [Hyphomicrobiaceae bacterium]|nr:TrkH family potassium uptake protein [Hyphomicrobiaceae bacterium]
MSAAVDIADGQQTWKVFFASSIGTFFVGGLLALVAYDDGHARIGIREGFLLTTLSWVVITAFAAMPFVGHGFSFTDSYFEAMSGLTTTGSTIIPNLDKQPRGILLWRAILCGFGGLGMIVIAIIMLPFLRVGGMQLFQTESSDKSEKVLPRAFQLVAATAGVYLVLIVACAVVYAALGMTFFDAVCHALPTLATGGYSSHDDSFGFFKSPSIEWAGIVFMALGAMPFVVFIKVFAGQPVTLWRDVQVRGFVTFLLAVSLMLGAWLSLTSGRPFLDAFRSALFNVTSIVTTTGFASEDYSKWGPFAVGLFFLLTFVGGCSGSTSGGIKIYRLQVTSILTRSHFLHLVSPNRIVMLAYNGRRLPEDVPFSVVAFLAIYMATVGLFTVVLSAFGLDLVTALTGAATALSNVGPGLGEIIGPAGNFSSLPPLAKWVLSLAMMLGRLELFTVLVLLRPEFWRN